MYYVLLLGDRYVLYSVLDIWKNQSTEHKLGRSRRGYTATQRYYWQLLSCCMLCKTYVLGIYSSGGHSTNSMMVKQIALGRIGTHQRCDNNSYIVSNNKPTMNAMNEVKANRPQKNDELSGKLCINSLRYKSKRTSDRK